jgi:dTDP-4-dehydrorhamnose reductase
VSADKDCTRPVLVLGANGQVGHELLRSLAPLAPVHAVRREQLDLTDADGMRALIRQTRPVAIVNAAAYTAVDKAESEADLAMQVNGVAPGILAELAAASGACFVHYSTDYVFDGAASEPYREDSPTSPLGVYGRTKLAGEQAALAANDAAIVLRTCWVYGTRGKNFLLTMERLAREQRKLRVVDDQRGCPTWARFIAETTAAILARCAVSADALRERRGVYHLAAGGDTNWCGFARAIVARMGDCADVEVEAIPTSAYPTPARRPAYSVLDTRLIGETFGVCMQPWTAMLDDAVAERRRS